jgi:UDP-N-acetylmuramoylalanine--D-glutamate ligase
LEADRIVVSPGVPATQAELCAALAAGIPIVGELAFAAEVLEQPMVAITGTNGKSTVTSFVGQLLEHGGMAPFVGGNLGRPLSEAALAGREYGVLVVEVSSYQLEWPGVFTPSVAVILNLTPDHLKRHRTMAGYAQTKARLFGGMRPDGLAILPEEDAFLREHAGCHGARHACLGALPGVTRAGTRVVVQLPSAERCEFDLGDFSVPGEHNRDNAAVAALLAVAIGAPLEAVRSALPALEALPHRMQPVGEFGGVRFVNDSKATNLDAVRVGLSGFPGRCVVLLGGQAKGAGFAGLAEVLAAHRVVTFGASGDAIAEELEGAGLVPVRARCLADGVSAACLLAEPGQTVLLCPGCASFDEFRDFEHRGAAFARLVEEGRGA